MIPPATSRDTLAFTLIELLVVISIIAVLAALAFPVLNGVAERGHTTRCAGNLRQIGLALITFAGEHEGEFPTAGADIKHGTSDPTTKLPGWTEQIEPYTGGYQPKLYVCPSSSVALPMNIQYSYFMGCHAAVAAKGGFSPLKTQLIVSPNTYILGGDIAANIFTSDDCDKDDYSQSPAFAAPPSFHQKQVNILFADGHVSAVASFDQNTMSTHYDGPGKPYLQP